MWDRPDLCEYALQKSQPLQLANLASSRDRDLLGWSILALVPLHFSSIRILDGVLDERSILHWIFSVSRGTRRQFRARTSGHMRERENKSLLSTTEYHTPHYASRLSDVVIFREAYIFLLRGHRIIDDTSNESAEKDITKNMLTIGANCAEKSHLHIWWDIYTRQIHHSNAHLAVPHRVLWDKTSRKQSILSTRQSTPYSSTVWGRHIKLPGKLSSHYALKNVAYKHITLAHCCLEVLWERPYFWFTFHIVSEIVISSMFSV